MPQNEEYLGVKQTVEKTGLSEHTLRYYEKIGLIGPVRRSSGGQRQFSENDLVWIDFLKCLKTTGMSVEHMTEYYNYVHEGDEGFEKRLALMSNHRDVILGRMEELESFLKAIEWKINYYKDLKEKYDNETENA